MGMDRFGKALMELGWEKVPKCECLFVQRKQKFFISVHVDDIKMAGKKQNLALMWKKLMNDVDIEEPTSFLDYVYLGCTQRECKPNEKIIGQDNKMFEPVFLLEQPSARDGQTSRENFSVFLRHGHPRKCVERNFELAK